MMSEKPAKEKRNPIEDTVAREFWGRLRQLALSDKPERAQARAIHELMFDVLEATASETLEDASPLASALLEQAGLTAAPPETRPDRVNAILARLREAEPKGLKPQAAAEILEEALKAVVDGAPDLNPPLARLVVAAVSGEFNDGRRVSTGDGPGGRHGNKKRSVDGPGVPVEDVFREAADQSRDVVLDEPAFRFLRRHSRLQDVDEAAWADRARLAIATGRILDTLDYQQLVDLTGRNRVAKIFGRIEPGTLFLMFHCGFIRAAKRLFTGYLPENGRPGLLLAAGGTHRAADDPGQALFSALRSLQAGHNLWVAPDGTLGRQSVTLDVLGTTSTGGEGAALLAHTARCPTVFFRLEVREGRLFPVIEAGPRCEPGEGFRDFSARFHRAYADKLTALLTGEPENLVLRPRWLRVFAEAEMAEQTS